jgi:CRISPR system Cascade subunit CasD
MQLESIADAIKKPHFTPYLGRRSCPIARPLFEQWVEAENFYDALASIEPCAGVIYSEEDIGGGRPDIYRDAPLLDRPRQFGNRTVYVYGR